MCASLRARLPPRFQGPQPPPNAADELLLFAVKSHIAKSIHDALIEMCLGETGFHLSATSRGEISDKTTAKALRLVADRRLDDGALGLQIPNQS